MARQQGQSQLDYLWVTYGQHHISDSLEDNSIPSSKLLKEITDGISQETLSNIKIINNQLIGNNKFGDQIFSIDIQEIIDGNRVITNFGKRYITQKDIDNGCEYTENTPVYFLKFSDNSELLAPIDVYFGQETNSIVVNISSNQISARLKINNSDTVVHLKDTADGIKSELRISPDIESIKLTKELEGLKAKIILDNQGKTLKFKYLSLSDYQALTTKDTTTVYFIEDQDYFYFGEHLIGNNITNLDNYYTKQETEDYVKNAVSEVSGLSWKTY